MGVSALKSVGAGGIMIMAPSPPPSPGSATYVMVWNMALLDDRIVKAAMLGMVYLDLTARP